MSKWVITIALIGAANHFFGSPHTGEANEIDSLLPDFISESCYLEMMRDYSAESSVERYERRQRGEFKCYEQDSPPRKSE